jgi:N-acetyl-1-D-myo-inositol-2-amino-2-deoxy-alpha-D-glucopyranoside deacetylase
MNKGAAGTAGGIAVAVPAALFVAVAGTALHRQQFMLAGTVLPWGAVAALLLLASVELWLGAATRSVIPTAVCGVICYALTGWWSTLEAGKRLVIGDLPGNIWVYGIAVVTVLMLAWCLRYRIRRD